MLAYIFAIVFPLLIGDFYKKRIKRLPVDFEDLNLEKQRGRYIFFALLPMFLLIALRNQGIGADTGVYLNHFRRMGNTAWSNLFDETKMDAGYVVFVKLITLITDEPFVFQIIYTAIYALAMTSFINQLQTSHFFTLFLYGTMGMYTFMFTGVRQCLAISICLISYRFIKKRQFIPFVLLMVLAFYFHKSSVMFLAAYLVYSLKLSTGLVLVYIPAILISVVNLQSLQQWFADQLDYEYGIESNAGGFFYVGLVLLISLVTICIANNNKEVNQESQGLLNIGLLSTVLWILRIFTRTAERPSYYFIMFLVSAFAYYIDSLKGKNRLHMKFVIFVLALLVFVYKLYFGQQAAYLPYRFYEF